jgi:hypothetical protein
VAARPFHGYDRAMMTGPSSERTPRAERRESLRYGDLVVKPRRPAVRRAFAALGVVFVAAALVGSCEAGRRRGLAAGEANGAAVRALRDRAENLAERNDALRREVAALRTSRAVADEAHMRVRRMLVDLENEVQRQREELDFYRTIVSPDDGVAGLRIQDFTVSAGAEGRLYRMQLVLVQAAKHDTPVSGVVNFSLEGASDGQPATFAASDLSPQAENSPLGFSFRYFKDLEQDVLLPAGFVPDRVVVEVSPEGDPERVIRQSFDWAVKS